MADPGDFSASKTAWRLALESQLSGLQPDERELLAKSTTASDIITTIQSSLNIAKRKRASRFLETIKRCTQPLNELQSVIDVLVQINPVVGCSVWAPLKLVLLAVQKHSRTFTAVADTVAVMVDALPRYNIYCEHFQNSDMLQNALGMVFATYVQFCVAITGLLDGKSAVELFLNIQVGVLDRRLEPILGQLKRHGRTVEQTATALSLVYVQDVKEMTAQMQTAGLSTREKENVERTLLWLAPEKFTEYHKTFSKHWVEGTCQWIIEQPETQEWMGKSAMSCEKRILWTTGLVGSGKTFAAHFISKFLTENGFPVFEFFFDSKNPQSTRRSESSFARTLLYQLLDRPELDSTKAFESLCEYRIRSGSRTASLSDELYTVMADLLNSLKAPFLVVDAIDECSPEELESILERIRGLCLRCCTLKILLTSRPTPEIKEFFDQELSALGLGITLSKEMVDRDIAKFVDFRIERSKKLQHPWIRTKVRSTLTQKAAGMFLYAKLVLDELEQEETVESVRQKLEALPNSLSAYYSDYFDRLKATPVSHQQLVRLIILWTIGTKVNLHVSSLVSALRAYMCASRDDNRKWTTAVKDDLLDPVTQIQSAAYPLIFISEDGMVQVAHFSVTEYVIKRDVLYYLAPTQPVNPSLGLSLAHHEIVVTCLHFMTQKLLRCNDAVVSTCLCIKSSPSWNSEDSGQGNASFMEYAVLFWDWHLVASEHFHEQQIQALCRFSNLETGAFQRWAGLRARVDFRFRICFGINQVEPRVTPLEIAVYSGAETWTRTILESSGDYQPGSDLMKAIHLSAERGFVWILERLGIGDWIETTDSQGRTPLHLAARNGNTEMVNFLLGHKANPDALDKTGHSALMHASSCGHRKVIEELLLAGANIHAKTYAGYCALSAASSHGFIEAVKCIVDYDHTTITNSQALLSASANGHEDVVAYLLAHGAAVSSRDWNLWTPLHWAARNGHNSVVKSLLQAGADANAVDRLERTPIIRPCRDGRVECVRTLLSARATLDFLDTTQLAPLHYAVMNGHDGVVQELRLAGADLELVSSYRRRPLHFAASNGHKSVVTQLIEAGVDLNAKDRNENDSALHLAAKSGFESIVNLLLCAKASSLVSRDITTAYTKSLQQDYRKYPPLCCALEEGHTSTAMTLLLDMEAQLKAQTLQYPDPGEWFDRALSISVDKQYPLELITAIIKATGRVANWSNTYRAATLAAARGLNDILSMFIQNGLEPPNEYPNPVLAEAIENDQVLTVKFLLERMKLDHIDLDTENPDSALNRVIRKHSLEMFELFQNKYHLSRSMRFKFIDKRTTDERVSLLGGSLDPVPSLDQYFRAVARTGNAEDLEKLVREKGHLLSQKQKNLILMESCPDGHVNVLKVLLEGGADANSIVIIAARCGQCDVLELLLYRYKANPNVVEWTGSLALHELSRPDCTALRLSDSLRLRMIHVLVDAGAVLDAVDKHGYTALHQSILRDDEAVLEELIKIGASTGSVGSLQITAMHVAAISGNTHFIRRLFELEVDVNAVDARSLTPLCWAAIKDIESCNDLNRGCLPGTFWGSHMQDYADYLDLSDQVKHYEVTRTLAKAGAALEYTDSNGRTPLHLACLSSRVDATRALLDAGADIHALDHNQRNPLHTAVIAGCLPCVRLLLEHGVDPNVVDSSTISQYESSARSSFIANCWSNITPSFFAISSSYAQFDGIVDDVGAEMIHYLLAAGADVCAVNNDDETILHVAVRSERCRIVEEILAFSGVADKVFKMKNKHGKTAADLAAESGSDRMMSMFGISTAERKPPWFQFLE